MYLKKLALIHCRSHPFPYTEADMAIWHGNPVLWVIPWWLQLSVHSVFNVHLHIWVEFTFVSPQNDWKYLDPFLKLLGLIPSPFSYFLCYGLSVHHILLHTHLWCLCPCRSVSPSWPDCDAVWLSPCLCLQHLIQWFSDFWREDHKRAHRDVAGPQHLHCSQLPRCQWWGHPFLKIHLCSPNRLRKFWVFYRFLGPIYRLPTPGGIQIPRVKNLRSTGLERQKSDRQGDNSSPVAVT